MSLEAKVNKKLKKMFGANVLAKHENGCMVLSGEVKLWSEVVKAGTISANKKKYSIVNNIICKTEPLTPIILPKLISSELEGQAPDVLVIGAGIVGCAIARELTKLDVSVLLADKEHDVALHASSRNDGMVHPGIDLKKGTKKQAYNLRGNKMYTEICAHLGVPFKRTGQFLCFNNIWVKPFLRIAVLYWKYLKVPVRYIGKKELLLAEPHLSKDICCALSFPTAGIVCPYSLTIAYAENAVQNGARVSLDTAILSMQTVNGVIKSVITNKGTLFPKVVINAAGVFSDDIAQMAGDKFFSIHPRKGTNSILDKAAAEKVKTITSGIGTTSTKTAHSKGGGMVSTIDENLLVGPDAVETNEREGFATSKQSITATFLKQSATVPALSTSDIITYFTGVRAATYEEDFIIQKGICAKNLVHAAGIQSPGLTAAPAIAVDVAELTKQILSEEKEIKPNKSFNPIRASIVKVSHLSLQQRDALIAENADYGEIVCRCEEISKGEIIDAMRRNIPCDTLDGIKRRVRPGMGRCQGGFCGPHIAKIIAKEKNMALNEVKKSGDGSQIVFCENKEDII